jgi:hypothetical protein
MQWALVYDAALCIPAGLIDRWLTKQDTIIQVFPANIREEERALAMMGQSVNAWKDSH